MLVLVFVDVVGVDIVVVVCNIDVIDDVGIGDDVKFFGVVMLIICLLLL